MPAFARGPVPATLFALICVAIAAAVRAALGYFAEDVVPYATFFPAVAIAALFAGLWSGSLTLLLGAVVAWVFFLPGDGLNRTGMINLMLYLSSGGAVLIVASGLRRVLDRLETNEASLRASNDRLLRSQTAGGIGHWELDFATREMSWSDSTFVLLGLAPTTGKMNLDVFSNLIHAEDRERVGTEILAMMKQKSQLESEFRVVWPDETVHWIAARGEYQKLHDGIEKFTGITFDVTDFKDLESELRLSERRYRKLVSSSSSIVLLADAAGHITQPIPSYEDFTGAKWPKYAGRSWRTAFHEDDTLAVERAWSAGIQAAKEFETSGRMWNDSTATWRWVHIRAVPLLNDAGKVEEWIGSITDIHDLQSAHEQQDVLINELRHRIKNTLAVVQALATQSRRYSAGDPMTAFLARLHAMARAHDLIMSTAWADVLLGDVIKRAIKPFIELDPLRIRMYGPAVRISANTSVYIALAFYELATNASKYGALSAPEGRVSVSWHREDSADSARVVIEWRELGGPQLEHTPEQRGFGLRLIENAVAREPSGLSEVTFDKSGLICRLSFLEMKRPALVATSAD